MSTSRRTLPSRLLTLTAVTVAAATATMAAAQGASNWPQGGYSGAHTGYNPTEKILGAGTVKHLKKKYTLANVNGVGVQGKTMYTAKPGGIYTAKLATGKKGRHYKVGVLSSDVPSTPIIDGKTMVSSIRNELFAYSLPGGKRLWSNTVKNPKNGSTDHLWQNTTTYDGIVFAILSTTSISTSATTTKLEAFSEKTGKLIWSKPNYFGPISAGGGRVYAQANGTNVGPGSYNHTITAFNALTGAASWAQPTEFALIQRISSIAVTASTIVVTCAGSVSGFDIYGLNPTTGAISWSYKDPTADAAPGGLSIVTDGSTVAYLSSNQDLVGLNLTTGAKRYIKSIGVDYTAIGANGVVYTINVQDRMVAYDLDTGAKLWTGPQTTTADYWPLAVAGGRLLATVQDSTVGGLEAFGKK